MFPALVEQVIALHAVDARGMLVPRKVLRPDALLASSALPPPRVMALQACGGAHDRARDPACAFRRLSARLLAALSINAGCHQRRVADGNAPDGEHGVRR